MYYKVTHISASLELVLSIFCWNRLFFKPYLSSSKNHRIKVFKVWTTFYKRLHNEQIPTNYKIFESFSNPLPVIYANEIKLNVGTLFRHSEEKRFLLALEITFHRNVSIAMASFYKMFFSVNVLNVSCEAWRW